MRHLALVTLGLLIACSAGGEESDAQGPSRDRGGRGDVSTGQADTDSGAPGSDVATVDVPVAPPEDSGPRVEDECAQVTAVGDPAFAPVDVIWAIDTSGSMDEETELVEEQLNQFVEFIEESGLDVRVVLIGADTVCVPAPLSTGDCPDADTDTYRHIRQIIGSHDAFEKVAATLTLYRDFLRPEAIKHFVVVSDDESEREAAWFRDEMTDRGLPFFVFHAIVSLEETPGPLGTTEGCTGVHGDAEAAGDRYIVMSEITEGTASSICEPDWSPIFDAIAANVIAGAALPCIYAIPDLGRGLVIVYEDVDVRINGVLLTHHDDEAGCATAPGWYYDDNEAPERVILCSSFCGSGFDGDEVAIEFGCVKG